VNRRAQAFHSRLPASDAELTINSELPDFLMLGDSPGQKTVSATPRPPFRTISKADLEAAPRDPVAGRPPASALDVTLTR
jgi:hypothetical protein